MKTRHSDLNGRCVCSWLRLQTDLKVQAELHDQSDFQLIVTSYLRDSYIWLSGSLIKFNVLCNVGYCHHFLLTDLNTQLVDTRRFLRHVRNWLSLSRQQSQVCLHISDRNRLQANKSVTVIYRTDSKGYGTSFQTRPWMPSFFFFFFFFFFYKTVFDLMLYR